MDLDKALGIAARGMDAQTTRLRIIAENLANQDTTGSTPGADPYRRKTVTFQNIFDRQLGTQVGAHDEQGVQGVHFGQRLPQTGHARIGFLVAKIALPQAEPFGWGRRPKGEGKQITPSKT